MFKGKIQIWCAVFAVAFILNGLVINVPKWIAGMDSPDLSVNVAFTDDINMGERIADRSFCNVDLSLTSTNADVIFADSGKSYEGYEKYSDYIYTPLVLYTRSVIMSNDTGVSKVDTTKTTAPYRIDLLKVLEGLEKGTDWRNLEISNKVAKGKVSLCIPNEESGYYDSVRTLFFNTLKGSNVLSPIDEELLYERVDNILAKCEKVKDIDGAIVNESSNPSVNYKVFIGPEYLYVRGSRSYYTYQKNSGFIPIYFYNTVNVSKDVWVKKDNTNSEVSENELSRHDLGVSFLTKIRDSKFFMEATGYRVRDFTFSVDDVSYVILKSL